MQDRLHTRIHRQSAAKARRQRGASVTEFLVALPALLLLGLGTVQSILAYNAKTTLTYATFEAARVGAVTHAQPSRMRSELGIRLAPIFGGDGSPARAADALRRASLDVQDPRYTQIEILNPTRAAFDDFGETDADGRRILPNDHLRYRNRDVGAQSGVNLQDANLLKIKITYGYDLQVPLIDRLLPAVLRQIDPANSVFYAAGRIPITAVATVRMHSDAWLAGNMVAGGPGGSVPDDGNNQVPDDGSGQVPDTGNDSGPGDDSDGQGGDGGDGYSTDDVPPVEIDDNGVVIGDNTPPAGLPDLLRPIPIPCTNCSSVDDNHGQMACVENNTAGNNAIASSIAVAPASQPSQLASTDVGNPIHVVTGNKYQAETDLSPLPGALGLTFTRHYNSQSRYKGPLGYGWTHSYDVTLRQDGEGYHLRQADGRGIRFTPSDTNTFTAARAQDGWLTKQGDQLQWHWRSGRTMQFNKALQLVRIVAADGTTVSLQYDAQNRLFLIRDAQRRELALSYYPNGRLKQLYDPAGQTTRYRYDDHGNLASATDAAGHTRQYHYEDPHDRHNLTGLTDARGIRYANWAYDNQDRAIASEHADGVERVTLAFGEDETTVTDSQGKTSVYHTEDRDGVALVTRIDGPGCSSCGLGDVQYHYNDAFQLTERRTKDGTAALYDYDDHGRLTRIDIQRPGQPLQTQVSYHYVGDDLQPHSIERPSLNPNGQHRVTLDYSALQQLTAVTEQGFRPRPDGGFDPIARRTALAYDANGQLSAIDGPRDDVEDVIRLTYDANGRVATITLPDGRTQQVLAHDAYGRPTHLRTAKQTPIELTYNTAGDITAITQGSRTVRYTYDAAGYLTGLTGPDGDSLRLAYDNAGRANALTGPNGERAGLSLDSEGRLSERRLKNPQGDVIRTVSYLYDAQGRLARTEHNQQQQHYRYDAAGRLTQVTDSAGNATDLRYNGLGQLLSLTQPDAGVTAYHYDDNQRLAGITDARDNTTRYVKDDFGRLVAQTSPDTGTTRYTHDAAGNVIEKITADDHKTTYRYDAANRLVEQQGEAGVTRLSYDQDSGRLTTIDSPQAHETFDYDNEGQLIRHTRTLDGHAFTTAYRYDEKTQKLIEKHLPDGQVLQYHYYTEGPDKNALRAITRKDLFGLAQTVIVGELDQRKADGSTSITYGNGLRSTTEYDAQGRPQTIQTSQALQLAYTYDANGQITGIDLNGTQQTYGYDRQGRLIEADTVLGTYRYDYDAVGNRIGQQHAADTVTKTEQYHYAKEGEGNRLLAIEKTNGKDEQATYHYNETGSPEQAGDLRYSYNADQRPIQVYKADQLIAEYSYNGFGERIKKVVYSGSQKHITYYLYDGNTLTAEADEKGRITAQYLYLDNRPVAKLQDRDIYAIHTDHLGTPRAVTDSDRKTVWQADYSPFGEAQIKTETIALNLRFPGQYADQETGTYYNYYRDYNPSTGRYQTSDPIGLKGGINTYAYVSGNPLGLVDPLGLHEIGEAHLHVGGDEPEGALVGSVAPVPVPDPVPPPTIDPTRPAANDPQFTRQNPSTGSTAGRVLISLGVTDVATGLIVGASIGQLVMGPAAGFTPEYFRSGNYRILIEEIREYDPSFTYSTFTEVPAQGDIEDLQRILWMHQTGRAGCGERAHEILARYPDAIRNPLPLPDFLTVLPAAQIQLSNGEYVEISEQNRERIREDLDYRAYLANGGTLSLEEWRAEGRPESPESETQGSPIDRPVYNSQPIETGTVINGVAIRDVRYGANGRIAVIGQGMNDPEGLGRGVLDIAEELRDMYEVETFEPSAEADQEWRDQLAEIRRERGQSARFTDAELEQLQTYAENEAWAQRIISEGYTVIDIGNPQGNSSSVFYDMEGRVVFGRR